MTNVKKSPPKNASRTLEGNGFSPAENGQTETAPTSPRPLSLRHNFAWALAGNVVYAATQWGMLVAIARLQSKEQLGRFALGLAITAPIFIFANLHLRTVQVTDARNEYSLGDYTGLRILSIAVGLAAVLAIVSWRAYFGSDELGVSLLILLVGVSKAIESLSDILHGYLQKNERMDRISQSLIIKGLLSLVAFVAVLASTDSLLVATASLCAAWLAMLLLFDLPSTKRVAADRVKIRPHWHWNQLWQLARLSLPVGIVVTLVSLAANIPRYFIEGFYGQAELGIFSAIAYLLVAGNTLIMALGQSVCPRLATSFSSGDLLTFRRITEKFIAIGLILGLCGILISVFWGRSLLLLIYGAEYSSAASFLVWMSVVVAASYIYSALGYALNAMRLFQPLMWMHFLTITFLIAACAWWVPTYSLNGAAWAMLSTTCLGILGLISLLIVQSRRIA